MPVLVLDRGQQEGTYCHHLEQDNQSMFRGTGRNLIS